MTKYVLGFMFNVEKTGVLLIEKQKPDWQKGLLNGVGGKVEEGEDYHEAIVREFEEETTIKQNEWNYVVTMSGDDWEVVVFTSTTDNIYNYQRVELERPCLVLLKELDYFPMMSNLKWLINMCLDDINYAINN